MGALRIPRQWDEVTPEWMTAALASRHPDARVAEVQLVMRDDGTNRRARFGLRALSGGEQRFNRELLHTMMENISLGISGAFFVALVASLAGIFFYILVRAAEVIVLRNRQKMEA